MKEENKRILKIIPAILLLPALGLACFRAWLLVFNIDVSNGLYTDTALGTVFGWLLFALLAVSLLIGFFVKKFTFDRPIKNESVMAAFAASVCAVMMAAIFCINVFDMVTGRRAWGVLLVAETVICIPGVIYFFRICVKGANPDANSSQAYSLLPLFPALYAAIRTISLFIDVSKPINASQRSFVLLTLVFIMMFFVTEAEYALPRDEMEQKKKQALLNSLTAKYYALGLAVSCLVLVIIMPYAFASAFWIYDTDTLLYNVMDICLGMYALVRVFSV
ncbi:MAG: hypothetical protein ACI4RV_09670 [Eubacteriales bacterium]